DDYGIKQKRRILKEKNKMTEKNQDKKKLQSAFASLNDDNNLSAGVCGPDGCEIDWSKAKKNVQDDQK
ncbi:MAG: hypothetical protein L0K83_03665, partial [Lactobacillus sp.]|nr:hypothetical protein [Lactobacillus sp.]